MQPYYINKHDRRVYLKISQHAKQRFIERFIKVHGRAPKKSADEMIRRMFMASTHIKTHLKKCKPRKRRRYSGDLYFRCNEFIFVVQDATIVTVFVPRKTFIRIMKARRLNHGAQANMWVF